MISFNESISNSNLSREKEVIAVTDKTISNTDYYQILIKGSETFDGATTTFYETVNVNASTLIVDWSSASKYNDPSKLESSFQTDLDGDGSVNTINSSSTTAVSTDKTGATLRQTTDGSLFIKDGNETIQISSGDGGYVDFTFTESWTGGSFSSEALAVQGIDSNSDNSVDFTN